MSTTCLYLGIIESVYAYQGGTQQPTVPQFGPSSLFKYDVFVNFPDGPQTVSRLTPVEERYADTVMVLPLQVGRPVIVASVGGMAQLMAHERLYIAPCGGEIPVQTGGTTIPPANVAPHPALAPPSNPPSDP